MISIPMFFMSLLFTVIITAVIAVFLEKKQLSSNEKIIKITRSDLDEVQDLYDFISTNYVEKVDKNKLIKGALTGMTNALGDSYSEFLDTKETKELDETISGIFEGIGANLQLENRLPVIQRAAKNSPAAKAGLRAGDVILEVDSRSTKNHSLEETAEMIRGKEGTSVKLLIRRGKDEFSVPVERETVSNETVSGDLDGQQPTIGSIQIENFRETTALELRNKIEELRKKGARAFIMDIRQNQGGLMKEAERVSSYFLKDGDTIAQFVNRKEVVSKDVAGKQMDEGFKVNEPAVFLVDQESASGAELVAAAVKSKKIPVIGVNTFGKGTVQNVQSIGKESYVQLTVMKWLTPEGEWLEGKGVAPTIQVEHSDHAKLPPISNQENWRIGDTGEPIKNINTMLNALGYNTSGAEFNEATRQAVIQIQTTNNLSTTGAIDAQTAKAIRTAIFQTVKKNDTAYEKAIELLSK